MPYIHERKDWPHFRWDAQRLSKQLAAVRYRQGRLLGRIGALGFALRAEATLNTLTEEVIKSSAIESERLDRKQVRSSIARRLGIDIGVLTPAERNIDGVVQMILDATDKYNDPLTDERLFSWHGALFPTGCSGLQKITVGAWRLDKTGPMQVVSGPNHRPHVHFEAPAAEKLDQEMKGFLNWFNTETSIDPVLIACIAYLWFVTIYPFDDGNGRVARAIADMSLARSEKSTQRFYSVSTQIRRERSAYYDILEATQKGDLDITDWLAWFLGCLDRAFDGADMILAAVFKKARFWEMNAGVQMNVRQRKVINRLLDGFKDKLTSSKWATLAKTSQDTALRDIEELVKHGILVRDAAGGRSTSYSLAEIDIPTQKSVITFDSHYQRDSGDHILFWGNGENRRIPFRISREALDDHFSDRDTLRPEAAFKKYRADIEALAQRKYLLGDLEPDDSILIRTGDID
jgi:Fic family protein